MIKIRYLETFEKNETLPLWNEAFPEDRQQFLDYYYKEKTKDNRILAAWEESSDKAKIVSMLHRNPYRLLIDGRAVDSDYVVAVATSKSKRHQGLMSRLLARMAADMYQDKMPFCYLMPADQRIYEPFGFAYIYDQEHWRLKESAQMQLKKQKLCLCHAGMAAEWMEQWLMKQYEVFAFRDEAYVKRLMLELESEQGWMEFLYHETDFQTNSTDEAFSANQSLCCSTDIAKIITGIQCWWGTEKTEQRMLLCPEQYREPEKSPSPAIMGRIIHLECCLELVHLRSDCPADEMEVILHVKDSLCPQNQGSFLWILNKQGSRLFRQEKDQNLLSVKYQINLSISTLTQWIFGYQDLPEEAVVNEPGRPSGWHRQIAVWKNVFLDEIV